MSGAPATVPAIPAGYMMRSDGSLVPESNVKAEHRLEDELVRNWLGRAKEVSAQLEDFRAKAFGDVDAFLELLAQQYGTTRGGVKGNFTLSSFDGTMQVQVSSGDFITFGPELQAAKSLIDTCISEWARGSNDNIQTIVNDAFAVGKEGKLQTDRILGLRRLHIEDPRWKRAMEAIGDAIRVVKSKRYVRFYERPNADTPMRQVPLDVARV